MITVPLGLVLFIAYTAAVYVIGLIMGIWTAHDFHGEFETTIECKPMCKPACKNYEEEAENLKEVVSKNVEER